ncbi:hypothetical protein [Eubacterium sp. 1001713B170207_170306_E7]|uniref:hypothetical protein n=1 Tax=Eubacterium sp. 1001713B170207_170306_E7 TaxID=2787097 RepID=UPI001898FF5B|nr:hypothetical protein [Eubacterium sp. 1001713B170207_170306_E7]
MKPEQSYEARAAILERPIACYEEVEGYPQSRVRVTFTDGSQLFFGGPLESFYEMILTHLAVSIPHCKQMAQEVLALKNETKIMLPIVIRPWLSFMVFERTEGPLFVNRFSVNERTGKRVF